MCHLVWDVCPCCQKRQGHVHVMHCPKFGKHHNANDPSHEIIEADKPMAIPCWDCKQREKAEKARTISPKEKHIVKFEEPTKNSTKKERGYTDEEAREDNRRRREELKKEQAAQKAVKQRAKEEAARASAEKKKAAREAAARMKIARKKASGEGGGSGDGNASSSLRKRDMLRKLVK